MKSISAMLLARLREFYRDKASFGWNLAFPFFIVIGFYFIFTTDDQPIYKIGLLGPESIEQLQPQEEFFSTKHLQFIAVKKQLGLKKVRQHKLDMLVQPGEPLEYWINSDSKNGFFLEKIMKGTVERPVVRGEVKGKEVPYIQWVVPGIIAMNIMFNCLWGVGYIVVKYRQDGYLKRLFATPIKPYQFLLGQIGARFIINFFVTLIVFLGCKWLIGFEVQGSYVDLFIVYFAGVFCLITLGLLTASRTTSKEFADGILNMISWPMMFFSEIWFSLEGSSDGVLLFSQMLPLTHLAQGSRKIIIEGASLGDISNHLIVMVAIGAIFLAASSLLFKWSPD